MDDQKGKSVSKLAKLPSLWAPGIEQWIFIGVWIFEKLQRFVWKMLLVSKVCSPVRFSLQILQISQKLKLPTELTPQCKGPQTLPLAYFDMLFSFLASVL